MAWYGINGVSAGTKNEAKEMHMIYAGPIHARNKRWFTKLSNKGMFSLIIFTIDKKHQLESAHLYLCMKKCTDRGVCACACA